MRTRNVDTKTFEALFDMYSSALFTHAYFRVSNREIAKDLVQETFLKAWQQQKKVADSSQQMVDQAVKPVENWKAFLYTVLNNLIIDHYRTKRGKDISLDMMEAGGEEGEGEFGGATPDGLKIGGLEAEGERFDSAVTSTAVREAVSQLALLDQQLVTLRFLNEDTTAEVAKQLNMTENAVYVRSHRALKKLKELLRGTQNSTNSL
jgi:RNA polymerase sigma-70 factor (ECF subfamily)